ncbi:MarR family winged helix-turn-helix transcriptional regulator [Streptomyces sp. NPDC048277]|uniref:MarR family winged helix-turn-helix transcriptional regulator n=1 Tax=Streptomyces sp. NPDC048277 TaxID=3155027 RepID=UPI003405DD98
MTTTAPLLNARVIALAHHAPRALLERVLDRHGVTFHQNVTLRLVAVADGSIARDDLAGEVTGALKTDVSVVHGVIGELTAGKLVEADPADATRLRVTDAGRELYETVSAESAEIAARLYAGIPEEDLAVAGRALTLITERANTELATA